MSWSIQTVFDNIEADGKVIAFTVIKGGVWPDNDYFFNVNGTESNS
jgi:hypothetical protein